MSFQIEIKPTERGFMRGEFKDGDGNDCVIQDSSLATDYMVRLGQLEGTHHRGHCLATMHLTKEMARTLIQALMRFVNNGTIAEIEQIDKDAFAEAFGLYMKTQEALQNADGPKLLWLFKNLPDAATERDRGFQCPVRGCPKRLNRFFSLGGVFQHMREKHPGELEKRLKLKKHTRRSK